MRRKIFSILAMTAVALMLVWPSGVDLSRVAADTAGSPSLVVSQLKITTGGQFVTLYNATDGTLDMAKYQLEYFNNYDLAKASSSKLITLSGTLPAHGYYMVSDDSLLLCYRLTVAAQSLGLSSTAGLLEVLAFNQNGPGGSVVPVLQDHVAWSKTAAPGVQTLPSSNGAFLRRQPLDNRGDPNVTAPGAGSWLAVQPDPADACGLIATSGAAQEASFGSSQLLPPGEPPASIVSLNTATNQTVPSLPAADVGLMAPQITELLPNPNGTGNDATNEFIELYNPNATSFDLSGFDLQTGLTTFRKYAFPAGSVLQPRGFKAFYSADTGLSLSNSGSQAKLLDPFGNAISFSDQYGNAKDGQAWALAKGKWYWTSRITPGSANVIEQPAVASKTATAKTKAAKTTTGAQPVAASTGDPQATGTVPIHASVLALVAAAALLYGAYEYRADLGNKFHQLRGYLKARGRHRPPP